MVRVRRTHAHLARVGLSLPAAGLSPSTPGQERCGRPGTRGWLRTLTDSELVCLPSPSEASADRGGSFSVTGSDSLHMLYRTSISIALILPWNFFLDCPNFLPWTLVLLTERQLKVVLFCWFYEHPCDGRGCTVKGRAGTWDPERRLVGSGAAACSLALGPGAVCSDQRGQCPRADPPGIPGGKAADSAGRARQGFPVVAPPVLLWAACWAPVGCHAVTCQDHSRLRSPSAARETGHQLLSVVPRGRQRPPGSRSATCASCRSAWPVCAGRPRRRPWPGGSESGLGTAGCAVRTKLSPLSSR